jgi:hypothetical protein
LAACIFVDFRYSRAMSDVLIGRASRPPEPLDETVQRNSSTGARCARKAGDDHGVSARSSHARRVEDTPSPVPNTAETTAPSGDTQEEGLSSRATELVDKLAAVDGALDRVLAELPGCDATSALTLAKRLGELAARVEGVTIHVHVHVARVYPSSPVDSVEEPYSDFAADALAAELEQSPRTMSARLESAWEIVHQLPAALAELTAGLLDRTRLLALHQLTVALSSEQRVTVEAAMLAGSRLASPPRWRRKIHRLIARMDPEAAARRRRRVHADRKIYVEPLEDGMAQLTAILAAEDARAVYDRIDRIVRADARASLGSNGGPADAARSGTGDNAELADAGRGQAGSGRGCAGFDGMGPGNAGSDREGSVGSGGGILGSVDSRSIDARRADVFTALLLGNRREYVNVEIQIIAPVGTLAGLDNNPVELVGHGLIPAHVGRALAADAHWRRVLTDPVSGTVLDLGHRRVPTPALARLVRHQQTRCLFPGCGMPATRTDIDHITPHAEGGCTALDNLSLLCRHHHRAKHSGWDLRQPRPGVFQWTAPTGHTYITDTTHNDEDKLPDKEAIQAPGAASDRLPTGRASTPTDVTSAPPAPTRCPF